MQCKADAILILGWLHLFSLSYHAKKNCSAIAGLGTMTKYYFLMHTYRVCECFKGPVWQDMHAIFYSSLLPRIPRIIDSKCFSKELTKHSRSDLDFWQNAILAGNSSRISVQQFRFRIESSEFWLMKSAKWFCFNSEVTHISIQIN